jgi:hypothetical protein
LDGAYWRLLAAAAPNKTTTSTGDPHTSDKHTGDAAGMLLHGPSSLIAENSMVLDTGYLT